VTMEAYNFGVVHKSPSFFISVSGNAIGIAIYLL
jgi:hypothetical protein